MMKMMMSLHKSKLLLTYITAFTTKTDDDALPELQLQFETINEQL